MADQTPDVIDAERPLRGTGRTVPPCQDAAGAARCAGTVALPIHGHGAVTTVAAWFFRASRGD